MKVIDDFRNDLLSRREIKAVVSSSGNPGFAEAGKMVSESLKAVEENIVVRNVLSKFGRDSFLIDAYVYDSEEHKNKIEPKKKEKKKE